MFEDSEGNIWVYNIFRSGENNWLLLDFDKQEKRWSLIPCLEYPRSLVRKANDSDFNIKNGDNLEDAFDYFYDNEEYVSYGILEHALCSYSQNTERWFTPDGRMVCSKILADRFFEGVEVFG